MVYRVLPQKAGNEVLDILNKSIDEKRSLSEFEHKKIEKCLTSLRRANEYSYDQIAICYYAQIVDIDKVLSCAHGIFKYGKIEDSLNAMAALNNTARYKDLYDYIRQYNIYDLLDRTTSDSRIDYLSKGILFSTILFGDADAGEKLLFQLLKEMHESSQIIKVNNFLKNNNKDREDIQLYVAECFDIFSRKFLPELIPLCDSFESTYYIVYADEDSDFLHFSFLFKAHEENVDKIIKLEDEFLALISKVDHNSSVKTKISFSFDLEEDA